MSPAEARAALETFLARYLPEIRARATGALASLRKQIPGAQELVYDNYNALVVAFGTTRKQSDIICSIALYPRWVTLFFMYGAGLDDPARMLKGSGKTIRHVVLADDAAIENPELRALIAQARRASPKAAELTGRGAMVIKSVSKKQRPRRPPPAAGGTGGGRAPRTARSGSPRTRAAR